MPDNTPIPVIDQLQHAFRQECFKLEAACTLTGVEALRLRWLGRKGEMAKLFASLKNTPKAERAALGQSLNALKQEIESELKRLHHRAQQQHIQELISGPSVDPSLPMALSSSGTHRGGLHPVTLMRQKILRILRRYGFVVLDGPEIESDFYNFSALNIPKDHAARDMQDTFYVQTQHEPHDQASHWMLRTQTSNIQIHALERYGPPLCFVAPGRVFRCDSDPTHSPLFHQIEGVMVDRDISMGDLKGTVVMLLRSLFGPDIEIRFRPSYFPFVEPGAEIDIRWRQHSTSDHNPISAPSWLEVGGCGMVHPNVFENSGCDSEDYRGFAFGFGIDRLAMLAWKSKITDLRQLFTADPELSSSFGVFPPPVSS